MPPRAAPASTRPFLAGERRTTLLSQRSWFPANQAKILSAWRKVMSSTPLNRRTLLTLLGGSIAAPLLPDTASSQEAWPARTVRYVNGFPAGGATDTLSRILCQKMSELSGQSFVVENRGGAGGVLQAVGGGKSPPHGYTVGLGGIATNVLAIGTYAKLPYDPREGFTFIGGMWQLPNIL